VVARRFLSGRPLYKTILAFALLGVAEIAIFFNSPRHFFVSDTLWLMGYRHRSIGEFLAAFVHVDQAMWYRPLAQRMVETVLFPFAGLNPIPYRVVGFLLFFSCTIAVFLLVRQVTQSRRVAWLSVLLFATNATNAFVTFDVCFTPELLFTLFFIGSAMAYVSFLRSRDRRFLALSAALFVGSLLSKETSVALPFTLAAIWFFLPGKKDRWTVRSLLPHFAILALYLAFAIGYLHIREIQAHQLVERPGHAGQRGYELVLGKNVFESASGAFGWAFGIPRLSYTEDMIPKRWMLAVLKDIRALFIVGAVFVLFTPRRNLMLLGLAWFVIVLLPTLPLLDHFLPYYLFAPLVGFALAGGIALDWIYVQCSRLAPAAGIAVCVAVLGLSGGIQAAAANRLAERYNILGQSSRNAGNTLKDVRRIHPTLPKGALLMIFNEENPFIFGDQAGGMLFQMAYDDPTLETWYSASGGPSPSNRYEHDKVFAFRLTNGHLLEIAP